MGKIEIAVCSNCFYSRVDDTQLVCCCVNSPNLWKQVKRIDRCCCYENYDYKKGDVNIRKDMSYEMKNKFEEQGNKKEPEFKDMDMVDRSKMYSKYKTDCFEEMLQVFGIDVLIGFCKCNVWKYRYRNTCEEDLKKADWYMEKLKDLNYLKYEEGVK